MLESFDIKMLFSSVSMLVTGYFWLIKARKERPCLRFHQLSDYRLTTRRHPKRDGWKRVCLTQQGTGGVLAVNHSTRQNSIILFECFLFTADGVIAGDWGYTGDDRPPWNVGPETTIAFSPAFFFDLPESAEVPDDPEFHAHFVTASGATFTHRFALETPPRGSSLPAPVARAA